MLCHFYRSNRKFDTYLYLVEKDDFSVVPDDLLRIFGDPEFSFSFDLQSERKLAREEASEVLENLQQQGYHLQLRDDVLIEQMLALKGLVMSVVFAPYYNLLRSLWLIKDIICGSSCADVMLCSADRELQ